MAVVPEKQHEEVRRLFQAVERLATMGSFSHLLICLWLTMPFSVAFLDFSACVFPFIYKNKTYPTCTKDGSKIDQLWCATTSNYDKGHRWKPCYETEHGGNTDGQPCVFPFVYKERSFFTCTDERVRPRMFWCATTNNFDKDKKWSYCADTILIKKPSHDVNQERTPCDTSVLYRLIASNRTQTADVES